MVMGVMVTEGARPHLPAERLRDPALSSEQDLPTVWDAAGLLPAGVGVPSRRGGPPREPLGLPPPTDRWKCWAPSPG